MVYMADHCSGLERWHYPDHSINLLHCAQLQKVSKCCFSQQFMPASNGCVVVQSNGLCMCLPPPPSTHTHTHTPDYVPNSPPPLATTTTVKTDSSLWRREGGKRWTQTLMLQTLVGLMFQLISSKGPGKNCPCPKYTMCNTLSTIHQSPSWAEECPTIFMRVTVCPFNRQVWTGSFLVTRSR